MYVYNMYVRVNIGYLQVCVGARATFTGVGRTYAYYDDAMTRAAIIESNKVSATESIYLSL